MIAYNFASNAIPSRARMKSNVNNNSLSKKFLIESEMLRAEANVIYCQF